MPSSTATPVALMTAGSAVMVMRPLVVMVLLLPDDPGAGLWGAAISTLKGRQDRTPLKCGSAWSTLTGGGLEVLAAADGGDGDVDGDGGEGLDATAAAAFVLLLLPVFAGGATTTTAGADPGAGGGGVPASCAPAKGATMIITIKEATRSSLLLQEARGSGISAIFATTVFWVSREKSVQHARAHVG